MEGGSPVTLGDAPAPTSIPAFGASWGDDNNIILGSVKGLLRMPVAEAPRTPLKKGLHRPRCIRTFCQAQRRFC